MKRKNFKMVAIVQILNNIRFEINAIFLILKS